MGALKIGQKIKTSRMKTAKVTELLGEGGQGAVYRAECGGRAMALKWFSKGKIKNPEKFRENIKNNISHGKPTDAFLWPEDVTEWIDGSFGYIMPLRPPKYSDFSDYLLARVSFKSVRALVNAALRITEGFAALHRAGFNYQDLNDGNFFVDFATGDVLICDNDNVMGHGYSSGIAGKCRYMAPEVVTGKKPDRQTDRYSLAVVLFLLLFGNHPLEGKATNPPCMTEELERKYYGVNPIFICDPDDKSNVPIPGIHKSVIAKWPLYPQYIRDAFVNAFGRERLLGIKPRMMEKEWLDIFIRLRSEIVTCRCGRENFSDAEKGAACKCGRIIKILDYIKLKKMNVPLFPAQYLYACHTVNDSEDFGTVTAEVVASKNNRGHIGLKNLSEYSWYVSGNDGKSSPISKNDVIKIESGAIIDFGRGLTGEIE